MKATTKRILSLLLAAALLTALAGCCGSKPGALPNEEAAATTPEDSTYDPGDTDGDGEGGSALLPASQLQWGLGVANGDMGNGDMDYEPPPVNRIAVVGGSGPRDGYTRAVCGDTWLDIRYIGEKEDTEEYDYFDTYENAYGPEYEILRPELAEGLRCATFFLYDLETWGGRNGDINYCPDVTDRPPANYDVEIAPMERAQGGRKVIHSDVIAAFALDGTDVNRLLLMRYENRENGLFQLVLLDEQEEFYTVDYPTEIVDGEAHWRVDWPDNPALWELLFAGTAADGPFLVTTWWAPEGENLMLWLAQDGKLVQAPLPGDEDFYIRAW